MSININYGPVLDSGGKIDFFFKNVLAFQAIEWKCHHNDVKAIVENKNTKIYTCATQFKKWMKVYVKSINVLCIHDNFEWRYQNESLCATIVWISS